MNVDTRYAAAAFVGGDEAAARTELERAFTGLEAVDEGAVAGEAS